MIQHQTILRVADNSGARTVKCIKVLTGFKKKISKIGEIILVSVKSLKKRRMFSKVKKGEIYKALIIRTKKKTFKKDGSSYKMNDNSVVLLNKKNNFISTRIKGPIPKIVKKNKIVRIESVSSGIF